MRYLVMKERHVHMGCNAVISVSGLRHLTQGQKPKRKFDPSKHIPDVLGRREKSEVVILSDTKSPRKAKTVKAMENWP